ncbi:MAG: FprA family A-type flavoprotein [Treponema sp.]|nr:FprA family A-type flavoprotein [Treponema sp.]
MKAQAIADGIYCIHADIRTEDYFEGIWPIPHGVSINSYLVIGEKIALIDLCRDWGGAPQQMEENLHSLGIQYNQIDYLILNHLEPDHTGCLGEFRTRNPKAQIFATQKGIDLVKSFYKLEEGLHAISDGETLDLGGKELVFFETPNVHWPDTMMTWDASSGTLFCCDAFGSYGALGDRVFDDEFNEEEHAFYETESLRYYANIVSSFSTFVDRAVKKLSPLDIKCVAPSHGMVWRKDPARIIQRYNTYASWAKGPAEKEIAVIWGSMYGNTKTGLDAVIEGIKEAGIPYTLYRVPDDNISYILAGAYKSSGLVIAMPTYEYAIFPPMAHVLDMFKRKHLFGKRTLRIGSWGWVGGAKKEYDAYLEALKWDSLESVEWAGSPSEADLALLRTRGQELARSLPHA